MPETSAGPVMSLALFAREIGPKVALQTVTARDRRQIQVPVTVEAGSDREVWLKLLARRHGHERHTLAEWHALIDRYGAEPAHPADPRYKG